MAEKKVSGKSKKKSDQPIKDRTYDDFLNEYKSQLRKRSTQTVNEPVKRTDRTADDARCGEIDPHTTVNPTVDHQILTKRAGRILSEDSGFKADSYNQRFELTPEMPEMSDGTVSEELEQTAIPGQQTMADMIAENADEEISVPIEGQIVNDEDAFMAAYKAYKTDYPLQFGKSEKLRAIARTAADDAGMDSESQLSFPAFSPLFKFSDEGGEKKKGKTQKNSKKTKKNKSDKNAERVFDIDEKDIVTNRVQTENEDEISSERSAVKTEKQKRFFEFLADSAVPKEIDAPFEIQEKGDVPEVLKKITGNSRTALVKSAALLIFAIAALAVLVATDETKTALRTGLSLLFTLLGALVCIKELAQGAKDAVKFKVTLHSGELLIIVSCILQHITAFATKSSPSLLSPSAVLSLLTLTLPQFLLSNNSKLTAGFFKTGSVSIFRTASDSGIDGAIKQKFTEDNGSLRYSSGTLFAAGLMQKLTNAVPKPFASTGFNLIIIIFAIISAIASAIISSDAMTGMTVFSGMLTTALPVSYLLAASLFLYNANNSLAKVRSSLISYKCAQKLTQTQAVVINASDIMERSACSLHDVKAVGKIDPVKATLSCAAVMNLASSPLKDAIKQLTAQIGEDIPDAENAEFSAKGVKAEVGGSTVLLGSRDHLEENGIYIPKKDYEADLLTGDRRLLYFAMDGKFTMLLAVSYHIKRFIPSFLRFLTAKNIKIILYSSDPNITPEYVMKKCRIKKTSVFASENAETNYFADKEKRTEPLLDSDVFTDGSLKALSVLISTAFRLNRVIDILPYAVYLCSFIGAIIITFAAFLGNPAFIGNTFIIIFRAATFVLTAILVPVLSKQKQEEK